MKPLLPSGLRDALEKAASRHYQERAWFGHGPEVSSPEEIFCALFDDNDIEGFAKSLQPGNGMHAELLGTLLIALEQMERAVPQLSTGFYDPAVVIDHPNWIAVREAAARVLANW